MNKLVEMDAVINEIEEWYEMYPDSDTAREVLTLLKRSVKKLPVYEEKWGCRLTKDGIEFAPRVQQIVKDE